MFARYLLKVAFVLALAVQGHAREYDAEADIGLVANNPEPAVASRNTELLSAALEAQWAGGKFKFAHAPVGPVLYPISCSAKQFFFAGTINTSKRIGGSLFGGGGRAYIMMEGEYSFAGRVGGAVTRFTRIDGEKGGPVFRLRGSGFILDRITMMGRRWPGGTDKNFVGTRTEACIEVEGRGATVATGGHTISNCLLAEAKYGIRTLAGYYDDAGRFVPDENHADQCVVQSVSFAGVESCFRSENQQSLGWSFRDIHADQSEGGGEMVIFDIVRGGNIMASNVLLNHSQITLFKVQDYSHNNQRLTCDGFKFDGSYIPGAYLTLFHYNGKVDLNSDISWMKWSLRVTGHAPTFDGAGPKGTYDIAKLIRTDDSAAKVGISKRDLLFDVTGMPLGNFEPAGGPWVRPK